MKKLYLAICALCLAAEALARPLPPLGERRYLLDERKPEKPTNIQSLQNTSEPSARVMKDPLPVDFKGFKVSAPKAPIVNQPKQAARLKFDKLPVKGRYLVPRVSFDRSKLDIKRADQDESPNYKKKIKESEDLLKDFSW